MKRLIGILFLLFVSLYSLLFLLQDAKASESQLDPIAIQLRWFHQFQFAGYYAAIEKGFYAEEGLHVTLREYDPNEDRIALVLDGKVQYGIGDPAILKLRHLGKPVVVLAQIFQHSPQVLISRNETGIFSPEDLAGRKVMLATDSIGSVPIRAMILDAQGDLDGISVVPHESSYAKLIEGSVDAMTAYLSNEPYLLKKMGFPVNIMDPRSYGIDFYGDNLFTVQKEIEEHPERVEKVIRATLKGWAYALEHKEEIISIILSKYNPELDHDQLRYEAKIIDQMVVPDLYNIGEIDPKRYARIAETYRRLRLIEISTIPDGFLYQRSSVKKAALTSEQKSWLSEHPDIQFGYIGSTPPEIIVNPDGTFSGTVVDFIASLNQKLGTDFGLRIYDLPQLIKKAKANKIDGIIMLQSEYAAELGLRMTNSFWPGYPAVFARRGTVFEGPYALDDKRVAITDQTWFPLKLLGQYGRKAMVVKVGSVLEGLRLVESGEADFYLGASHNSYLVAEHRLYSVSTAHVFFDSPVMFGIGVRSDWPQLVSILNKGISRFPEPEISAIIQKYSFLPEKKERIILTPEERAWVERNYTVRVFSTEHSPLMTFIEGKPSGISVDLLNEISRRTRIKFEIGEPNLDFPSAVKGLTEKSGPDVIAGVNPTPEREKTILFTKPFISSPKFIFTRDDAPFVYSMKNLLGRTVAVVKGYVTHKLLEENYPEIALLVYESNEKALRAVSSGKAFAFIGSLMATSSMINGYGLTNIKASVPSALPDAIVGMGVRSDWPELRSIMDKVFDSMPTSEKNAIINKWSAIKVDYGFSPADILKWTLILAGGAFLIVSFFLFWNRNLAKKVRERTLELEKKNQSLTAEIVQRANAERLLQESGDYLESLLNSIPEAVFSIKMPERVIEWAKDTYDLFGYASGEYLGKTTEFLYPSKKDFLDEGKRIESLIAEGKEVFSFERTLRKKNGELFPADIKLSFFRIDGKLVRITAIVRNIAERKRAEEALKKSEKTLKEAQRIAHLGNWELDIPSGALIWSDEIFRIFEVDKGNFDASYEAFLNLVHPDDRIMVDEAYTRSLATRQPYALSHRLLMSDGSVKYVHEQCETSYDAQGKPRRSIGTVQDITDLKQKERELEHYQKRLKALAYQLTLAEEKQRRSIAADLHDQIGHSLALARIQLNGIMEAKSELEKNILVKDVSNILLTALRDTKTLISELSSPSMNEIGLGSAISEWLEEQIATRHGLETEFVDDFSERHKNTLDENARALIFRNVRELLVNTVKHAKAKKLRVHLFEEAGMLKVVVQDDGIGFDPALQKKKTGKIVGFGLFSVQERMTEMGGAVDIQSEPGKGCITTLMAPVERIEKV